MHNAINYIAKNGGLFAKKLLVFSLLLCIVAVFLVSTASAAFQAECYCVRSCCDCDCQEECACVTIICSVCEVVIERREVLRQKIAVVSPAHCVDTGLISAADALLESNSNLVEFSIRMNN